MKNKKNIILLVVALLAAIVSFFIPISSYTGTEKILTLIIRAIIIGASIMIIGSLICKKTNKYDAFKVLLITALTVMVFSFLIPKSQMGYTGIEKGDLINPITFIDSLSNGLTSFSVFIAQFIYIISIGIFYAVLKKSEKYDSMVNNIAAVLKKLGVFILVISILILGILTAVIGDILPMLIFVPLLIDIIKKVGFDSKRAIASTVGAILLGNAGSLYTNYTNQILATTVTANIIVKLVILVMSLVALILFVVLGSKPKDTNLTIKKFEKGLPIYITLSVMMILLILGLVPWNGYFGFEGFSNFHNTIIDFKVFKLSLFESLIGTTLLAFGEWSIYSLIVLLNVASIVLAIIYKIKSDSLLETIAKGVKKALPYGLILILANVILVGVYNSGFYTTVLASLAEMKDKILSSTTASVLSAVTYPDYAYANQFTLSTFATIISNSAMFVVLAVIFQAMYSLALLISPTSVLILMALRYENVEYKDWIKYIYKFFLGILIVYFMVMMIIGGKFVKTISYVVLAVLVVILVLLFVLSKDKKEEKVVEEKKEEKTKTKKVATKKTTVKKATTKKK